jgi:hypothetical protein
MAQTRKNGPRTPMERLISESVERALATWLSGQAIRVTEELGRELWDDEAFRTAFLAAARRAATDALARLEQSRAGRHD